MCTVVVNNDEQQIRALLYLIYLFINFTNIQNYTTGQQDMSPM
jgi:hypothetical protein